MRESVIPIKAEAGQSDNPGNIIVWVVHVSRSRQAELEYDVALGRMRDVVVTRRSIFKQSGNKKSLRISMLRSRGVNQAGRNGANDMNLQFSKPELTSLREKVTPIFEQLSRGETMKLSLLVLSGMNVSDLDFNGSSIGLMVDESTFESCNLARTDLTGMYFRGGRLSKVSFESASLVKSEIYRCTLEQVSFENCNLNRAEITECRLSGVSFKGASLIGASFDECDLRGLSFHEAILDGTYFFGCLLDEALMNSPGVILKDAIG